MRNKTLATVAVLVLGCAANADVVLNQISVTEGDNGPASVSQDFEAAFNANDIVFADDFTVDSLHLSVTRVEAVAALFTGGGPLSDSVWATVTGFRVEFYTSIAAAVGSPTLAGNAGSQFVPIGSVTRTNLGFLSNGSASLVDMALSVTLPSAGTYWLAVMAAMPAGASGNQHGITQNNTSPGNTNATWVNPGGGFSLSGNFQNSNADASYRLHAVPEPGSMIALGIGVAALLARRRRRTV